MPYSNEPAPKPVPTPVQEAEEILRRFELSVAVGMTRISGYYSDLFS